MSENQQEFDIIRVSHPSRLGVIQYDEYICLSSDEVQSVLNRFDNNNVKNVVSNSSEYDSNFPSFVTCKTEVGLEEELMMFENPKNEDFLGLPCYGCRLKSLREFPNEVDNPNNILWTSWSTHRRYDGLNNTECPRIPCIAITYVDHSDIPQVFEDGIIERFKVVIALICSDQVIFDIMRNKIKSDRLIVVNEKEKKIVTFVYARDPADFKECLMYKYQETQFLWAKKDCHEIVTVEEARELISRARMEIEEKEFI